MQSERTELLADLVASALDCAISERAQFLSDVCGDDVALRDEAESLLRFEESAREFIETPAFEVLDFLNGVTGPIAGEASVSPSEAEPLAAEEPVLESTTTEQPIAQAPRVESESTGLVSAREQTYASEPIESMVARKPIVESEPTKPIIEQAPILEDEAAKPATARKSNHRSEAVIESGPERRRPETERIDREKTAAAIPQESKTKPIPPPAKKASDSFEIPEYPPKKPIPSRFAVWRRRAAVIAAILLLVGMAVALIAALLDARDARHERDVAEAERSRSEYINNYLQRIIFLSDQNFTSVWPVPQNRNTTVTEMLDRIAPSVQKELANQPATRGELLRLIGKAYASQGHYDAAEKNLRAALQTQTAFYGGQNAEVTETIVDLGILLYRREKFSEAEELLEKGIAFLRRQNQTLAGRANAVKLAHALDRLGEVKFYRGEVKASRAILEEALEVATQAQPDAHDRPVLTHIKTDLGGLLVLVGELTRGEGLLQESLAESRAARGPQWETGMTMQMLGELALAKNRATEAEENFLAAEEIFRKTLGEKNLYFARNLERRATVSLIENDLSTAEQLAQRSLALTKECSPDNRLPWTDPMMTLSSIMLRQRRAAEGEDYLRKTIHICEEQPARNYAAIGLAKIRLSQLLLSQDRFTEAENLAFEAHNQAQQHLEPDDPLRKATTNNLIEIYEKQQKYKAAREVK